MDPATATPNRNRHTNLILMASCRGEEKQMDSATTTPNRNRQPDLILAASCRGEEKQKENPDVA